jgi:hypothetical protein
MVGINLPPGHDLGIRLSRLDTATRTLATRDVLQNASIGAGGLLVMGGGSITIQSPGTLNLGGGVLSVSASFTAGTTITAGTDVDAGGNANIAGTVTATAGINSVGVYNTAVNIGSFRTVSANVSGQLGNTVSSRRFKEQIEGAPDMQDGVMGLRVVTFVYIEDAEINGDQATVQLGLIAEEVDDLGLSFMIDYEDDGATPHGVKYERVALALIPVTQQQQSRLNELEARLSRAGL